MFFFFIAEVASDRKTEAAAKRGKATGKEPDRKAWRRKRAFRRIEVSPAADSVEKFIISDLGGFWPFNSLKWKNRVTCRCRTATVLTRTVVNDKAARDRRWSGFPRVARGRNARAPKPPNNVASTIFSVVHLLQGAPSNLVTPLIPRTVKVVVRDTRYTFLFLLALVGVLFTPSSSECWRVPKRLRVFRHGWWLPAAARIAVVAKQKRLWGNSRLRLLQRADSHLISVVEEAFVAIAVSALWRMLMNTCLSLQERAYPVPFWRCTDARQVLGRVGSSCNVRKMELLPSCRTKHSVKNFPPVELNPGFLRWPVTN